MNKQRINLLCDLEEKLEINFKDKDILNTALTHSSYANMKKNIEYNERLEFLGDSVLQLIISEYLFSTFADKTEGELTKIRSLIVCENSLFEISKVLQLGRFILLSKGEELTGGRTRVSILADCVEAIIAAIYLDSGYNRVKEFILTNFKEIIKKAVNNEIILDYKTKLQETVQKSGDVSIRYNLLKYEGPPHRRKFYVQVLVNGEIKGEGNGYSKKEAEQHAAKKAIERNELEFE